MTRNGITLTAGKTRFHLDETYLGITRGIYMQIDRLYETPDGTMRAIFSYTGGETPERDKSVDLLTQHIGTKLSLADPETP